MKNKNDIKKTIVDAYGNIARSTASCCCSCSCSSNQTIQIQTKKLGYSQDELSSAPPGANLGLGCGNPVAIASLKPGEIVLDLGAGAGFDAFLASKRVGLMGKVIGIDASDEMLALARNNAEKAKITNVEFLKGDIENLPVKDNFINVVISNCVINLAPDKKRVFGEIYRVLKKGGRLMVSDTVLVKPLPKRILEDKEMLVGCVSGAILKDKYLLFLKKAGFGKITIHKCSDGFLKGYSQSITYSATK